MAPTVCREAIGGDEKDAARGGRKASKRIRMAPLIIETTIQIKPSHATQKVIDVVGLYLNPPEHAQVLCAD